MRARWLALMFLLGCRREQPRPAIAADDTGTASATKVGLFDRIPPIPDDTTTLASYRSDAIAFVSFLKATMQVPACLDEQVAHVDAFFQLTTDSKQVTHAMHGAFGRDELESCLAKVTDDVFRDKSRWERDGAITKVTVGTRPANFVGYTTDGWVGWSSEEGRLLAWMASKRTLPEPLVPLATRAKSEHAAAAATLMAMDLSRSLLGVPSLGSIMLIDGASLHDGGPKTISAVVLYATADAAKSAVNAVFGAARDTRNPEALRTILTGLKPDARGTEMVMDLTEAFKNPEVVRDAVTHALPH